MKKQFFRLLLCFCFALGMMQATALAEGTTHTDHCVCGKATTETVNGHTHDATIPAWQAWTSTDSLPPSGGYYYLTKDVTISGTWTPAKGTVLCLNGYKIEASGKAIQVNASCTFTLTDCGTNGTITSMSKNTNVGVYVEGIFQMYGGTITGFHAGYYGGVYNGGTFQMYGGAISGNIAEQYGGGVYNGGTFQMYGGEISGNSASEYGGGVYNGVTFQMYGGEISGNNAREKGGGVYNIGTFQMYGGEISNNSVEYYGGGGVCNEGTTFEVSGNAKIINNKKGTGENATANNVYLASNKTITIGTGGLGSDAQISVTTKDTPTGGNPVAITGDCDKDYSSHFTSDNATYQIGMGKDGVLKLAVKGSETHTDHCICGATHTEIGDHDDDDKYTGGWTAWLEGDSLPATAGHYYLTKDVTLSAGGEYPEVWYPTDGTVLCLNGKTITTNVTSGNTMAIKVDNGCTFTLTDCGTNGKITSVNGNTKVGVYVEGTFQMYGGTITGVHTEYSGGGVYNGGTFRMYGGEISGNSADTNGGGVYLEENSTFQMYGGEISDNSAGKNGGGVYNDGTTFEVSGNAKIINNTKGTGKSATANNVYLRLDKTITIGTDGLGSDAKIGVTTATKPTDGNPVAITGNCDKDYSSYFKSDDNTYRILKYEGNAVKLTTKTHANHCICGATETVNGHTHDATIPAWTAWDETQSTNYKTSLPTEPGCYYLTDDVTIDSAWCPANDTVLCLNGYKITRSELKSSGIVVGERCTFTLTDCRTNGTITCEIQCDHGVWVSSTAFFKMYGGKITGFCGSGTGGGVYVQDNSTFQMYGGEISGNMVQGGGGVSNSGTFQMYGGEISGNSAEGSGSGVSNSATFQMYGGKISGNRATFYSGVYNMKDATFQMNGGEISDNSAKYSNGGGVYNEGEFVVSGNVKIINNTKGTGESVTANNVCLASGKTITIGTGGLGSDVKIGVTTATEPTKDTPVPITSNGGSTSNFTSDNGAYVIASENGKVVLKLPEIVLSQTGTLDFGRMKRGYADITPTTITVTNKGGSAKTFSVVLSGENADAFAISSEALNGIAVNDTGSFGIAPETGLGKGTYTATVTVRDEAGLAVSFDVTFSVYKKSSNNNDVVPATPPVVPEEKKHEITVDSTNGTVSVAPQSAKAGDTVTVTVENNKHYTTVGINVQDANGDFIPVTENADGTFSFTMPQGDVKVTPIYNWNNPFKDVGEDDYFAAAVEWALANGITSGINADEFGANLNCTRADLVTFLWRIAGSPVVGDAVAFADVSADAYYAAAVRWAASLGIVNGYGNGLFGTDDNVTREQLVAILYRFAVQMDMDVSVGADTNILSYRDAFSVSEYAMEAFQWACGAGVVYGEGGNLMPGNHCTRAQIVTMLYRLLSE